MPISPEQLANYLHVAGVSAHLVPQDKSVESWDAYRLRVAIALLPLLTPEEDTPPEVAIDS